MENIRFVFPLPLGGRTDPDLRVPIENWHFEEAERGHQAVEAPLCPWEDTFDCERWVAGNS